MSKTPWYYLDMKNSNKSQGFTPTLRLTSLQNIFSNVSKLIKNAIGYLFLKDACEQQQKNNVNLRVGFTLIELLVAIAIIGVLSAVVLMSLDAARQKSRDGQRVTQMQEFMKALELYYSDTGSYPCAYSGCADAGVAHFTIGENAADDLASSIYIKRIPPDPYYSDALTCDGNASGYCYCGTGNSFVLTVNSENDAGGGASNRCYISRGVTAGLCADHLTNHASVACADRF